MFSPIAFVLGLALAVGAPQVRAALQSQQAVPTTSPDFGETFSAAQRALEDKRWPAVILKAQEILASSKRTPDDTFAAYYFLLEAHKGMKDRSGMRVAIQGMLDSGFPIASNTRASLERVLESRILRPPQD